MKKKILRLPPRPSSRHRWSPDDQQEAETATVSASSESSYPSSPSSSQRPSFRASTSVYSTARFVVGSLAACFVPSNYKSISENSLDSHPTNQTSVPTSGSNGQIANRTRQLYNPRMVEEQACNRTFTMEQIYNATMNFNPSLKIGQGGFGTVYKGTLDDGTIVAAKRAKKGLYDDHMGIEFRREVETLAQVKHLNLVQLLGFVKEEGESILVVEYVSNGNLREHLDGKRGNHLDFSSRVDIAIDLAHAITYLHTYTDHPIIHRDIKPSNILLTDKCRVKVADFGFARLAADRDSGATHVSTQVKGTTGYLDPEYVKTRQLTDKSDVYSFGVVLVELFSGRRPIQSSREFKEKLTAKWAIKKLMDGNGISVLDPTLERNSANNWALERILELAFKCLVPRRDTRPSMKRCAEVLWSIRKDYREKSAIRHSLNSSEIEE